MLPEFVNLADVGMVERGGRPGFPLKAFHGGRVIGPFFRQELQSYPTAQLDVLRLVDHTHAPAAKDFQYSVVGNSFANQVRSGSPWQRGHGWSTRRRTSSWAVG